MIRIKINNKVHRLANDWHDLTVRQAIAINSLPLPVTNYSDPAEWVTGDTIDYISKVFGICANMDRAEMHNVNAADIKAYFMKYLLNFVVDLHSIEPVTYTPNFIKQFDFDGEIYELPKSLKIESKMLPMYSSTANDFVESSNVMSHIAKLGKEGIKHMPYIVAIYCRPKGEGFDEKILIERAQKFNELPMAIVWEVFFCIQNYTQLYMINILNYISQQMRGLAMLQKIQGWFKKVFRPGYTGWLNRKLQAQSMK